MLQGLLVLIIGLPIILSANTLVIRAPWLSILGCSLWGIGFLFEATADRQLQNYLSNKNHPKVLERGLWKYSRHPNYFGELLQWWAIAIIILQVSYGWVGFTGPLTLSFLIILYFRDTTN